MKRELTNQELLDRYIYSVKMTLPPSQTNDIAEERLASIAVLNSRK